MNGADTVFTRAAVRRPRRAQHRAHRRRHLQRRGRRHRHPGRPARSDRSRSAGGARSASSPLCSRALGDDGADLPLGRPERAAAPAATASLDTEDLNGDHLLNAARARTRTSSATSWTSPRTASTCATASPSRRAGPHCHLEALPHSDPQRRPTTIGTPDTPAGAAAADHGRWRRRTPADPDIVARSPWRGSGSWARPGSAASDTPIVGLARRRPASRTARSSASRRLAPRTDRPGVRARRPASSTRCSPVGGDQQSGGTQINEKSLRIIARGPAPGRARRGVPPLPGGRRRTC